VNMKCYITKYPRAKPSAGNKNQRR
jgi:hypothetical protein